MKRICFVGLTIMIVMLFSGLMTIQTKASIQNPGEDQSASNNSYSEIDQLSLEASFSQEACNFNGICEAGEHTGNCSSDCPAPGPVGSDYGVCQEANIATQDAPDYTLTVNASASLGYYSRFWDCIGADEFNSNFLPSDEDLCSGAVCDYLGVSSPCPCNLDPTSLVNAAAMDLYAQTTPRGRSAWTAYRASSMLCDEVDDREEPINKTRRFRGARIYSEDQNGQPQYDWTILDAALDRLLNRYGMVPILSMSFMPDALAEDITSAVSWSGCPKTPPNDPEKWGEFMGAFAQHILDRYGTQALDWPFEIWNEPDLSNFFWVCDPDKACCTDPYGWNDNCDVGGVSTSPTGDVDRYAELYKYAAQAIKAVNESFIVGGAAIAGDIGRFQTPFVEDYVGNTSATNGFPTEYFNFLSRHAYPSHIDDLLKKTAAALVQIAWSRPDIFAQRPDDFGYLITETGPTASVGYDFQNTRFVAGWAVKQVDGYLGLMTHNVCKGGTRSGLYCETSADCPSSGSNYDCISGRAYLPEKTCFWTKPVPEQNGLADTHFGLVVSTDDNPDNIVKRASFNAYHALGFLSDEQIQLTGSEYGDLVHGFATRNNQDSVEVILYNYDDDDENNTSTPPAVIELQFTDLPFESFKVSQFLIDENCSNAYDDFQAGKSISEQQARDDLELAMPQYTAQAVDGSWSTRFRLGGNSVTLIVLEREGETPTFEDVPFSHPYHDYIEELYQEGYTAGCSASPLKYCPEATMTRAESAVFVERGIHGAGYLPGEATEQIFADVALGEWYAKWSTALWEDEYTAGCGTNPLVYCPMQGHTRAEGAVFYLRMLNGAEYEPPAAQGLFSDVDLGEWYAKWVEAAYQAGLIEACQTGTELRYCPEDPLTRAVAAYMMVQAKGLTIP
jgi:hypothetical protein